VTRPIATAARALTGCGSLSVQPRLVHGAGVVSSPEDAGGIGVEFVDDDVDRLAGLEVEVLDPLAVAVAEVEGPEPGALVTELCDRHRGPIAGPAAPDRTLLVDGDALASHGDLEADLVLELFGDAAATGAPNPLDIDVGEGAALPRLEAKASVARSTLRRCSR
jgi:hypothetical protein